MHARACVFTSILGTDPMIVIDRFRRILSEITINHVRSWEN